MFLRAPGGYARVYPLIDIADYEIWGFDPALQLDAAAIEEERLRTRVPMGGVIRSIATAYFASIETSYVFAAPVETTLGPVEEALGLLQMDFTRRTLGSFWREMFPVAYELQGRGDPDGGA